MKKIVFKAYPKYIFTLMVLILFALVAEVVYLYPSPCSQKKKIQHEIEKPLIYRDDYPLISESDLYCSFFILEVKKLDTKIVAAEKGEEKTLLSDSDVFFINKGKDDGLEINQVFLIIEIGQEIKNPVTRKKIGWLGLKRGRARIVDPGESWGKAVVEKACGQVKVGNFLIPLVEEEALSETEPAPDVPSEREEISVGNIIYLERNYQQIASGQWALIDLGSDAGVSVGDRMIIFKDVSGGLPPQTIGELIIIDTQPETSTVKILSSRDAVRIGYKVKISGQ